MFKSFFESGTIISMSILGTVFMSPNHPLIGNLLGILASPAAFISTLRLKADDYKLCSTYTITNLKGEEEKYLGLFKTFIKI